MIGIRAYERRDDLRANNSRLLEYVRTAARCIVQYNRARVQRRAYGPYPAQISNNRITDEIAPVQVLDPNDPVFTTPNRITIRRVGYWVQERGLNFLGEKDSRYRDLVQLADPFPNNPGEKRGALVEATYGQGPVDLHRARPLAPGAGRHRRRVPDPGEPDQRRTLIAPHPSITHMRRPL